MKKIIFILAIFLSNIALADEAKYRIVCDGANFHYGENIVDFKFFFDGSNQNLFQLRMQKGSTEYVSNNNCVIKTIKK